MATLPGITKRPDRRQFQGDMLWNVGGLAVSAVAGILLQFLIGTHYGAAALGVFNQVFAVYIFASQLAVLGVHHSLLKYASAATSEAEVRHANTAALLIAVLLAAVTCALVGAVAGSVAAVVDSPAVRDGIYLACPGLFFFAINKVSLAHLNAMHRMRSFAVFGASRFLLMLIGLICCIALDVRGDSLAIVLSLGEAGVFLLSFWTLVSKLSSPLTAAVREWMGRHLRFGIKGFLSGMLVELNTRVDVLMLGVFASDVVVGVYSFAAIFAEGVYQLLVVARSNYNPILAKLLAAGERTELMRVVRHGKRVIYPLMVAIAAVAIAVYWGLLPLVTSDAALHGSWVLFAILVAGITAGAGYTPFNHVLLQAGLPGWHTLTTLTIVIFNVILNLVFITQYGARGAAIATASAFVFAALVLVMASRRLLGLKI